MNRKSNTPVIEFLEQNPISAVVLAVATLVILVFVGRVADRIMTRILTHRHELQLQKRYDELDKRPSWCGTGRIRDRAGSEFTCVRDAVSRMKAAGDYLLLIDHARNVDEQLELIRGMPEIEEIIFWEEVDLTAKGMKHIGTLPNLRSIETFAPVGDEGLLALRGCKLLERVYIYGRGITPGGIAEFQTHFSKSQNELPTV